MFQTPSSNSRIKKKRERKKTKLKKVKTGESELLISIKGSFCDMPLLLLSKNAALITY
jgi:hypothetical protein